MESVVPNSCSIASTSSRAGPRPTVLFVDRHALVLKAPSAPCGVRCLQPQPLPKRIFNLATQECFGQGVRLWSSMGCWRLGRGFGCGFVRRRPRRGSVRRVWGSGCRRGVRRRWSEAGCLKRSSRWARLPAGPNAMEAKRAFPLPERGAVRGTIETHETCGGAQSVLRRRGLARHPHPHPVKLSRQPWRMR